MSTKKITLNELRSLIKHIIKEEVQDNNFDYKWIGEDILELSEKTKEAILDDSELQDFIHERHFGFNKKNGFPLLGVDWMDYEQFDKLAKFLKIKY